MASEYKKLLERAFEQVPHKPHSESRFERPLPFIEKLGNKTSITNLQELAVKLNRDPKQVLKFLAKELATSGSLIGGKAVFQGRFTEITFQRLVTIFINKYVICPICKSPDTKVIKEGDFNFLICEACGAKSSIIE
ncbi:translation initiation factor IF-2 subunit beta [[Eubacterium] cellulosolvens]